MSDPTTMFRPPAQPDRPEPHGPLGAIFAPRAVAVIGATEKAGSVGRSILWNLISSPFGGTVYPVNPKRPNVLGIRSYPSIAAVPEPVDLAVVVTPAAASPRSSASAPTPASRARSSFRRASRRSGRRAPSSNARCWSRPGAARCGSSAPTAWA